MKVPFLFFLLFSFNLNAGVDRRPAIEEKCDVNEEGCDSNEKKCNLNIAIDKAQGEKVFNGLITHQVIIRSGDDLGCSMLPNKRYADSVYEENARNEMQILFKKKADNYSKECIEYFTKRGMKFNCKTPEIVAMTFGHACEKKVENITGKVSHAAVVNTEIKYKQIGWHLEEKLPSDIQKELCARVKKCMGQASDEEMQELKDLLPGACYSEINPPTLKSPAAKSDPVGFDGKRDTGVIKKSEKPAPKKLESNKGQEI